MLEIAKDPSLLVYEKPELLNDRAMHYCPGCAHATIHKVLAGVLQRMGLQKKCIGVSPVGCAVFMYNYIDIDWIEAAHGRACAVATAANRLNPDRLVFTYQGDGDIAAIGSSETIHACNRGENITIIYVNNAVYGMTGGQMAPTTPVGMRTTTCPTGRTPEINGYPIRFAELLVQLDGTCYVTRQQVATRGGVLALDKVLERAFDNTLAKRGTSVVEVLAACPSGWKMNPVDANQLMIKSVLPNYKMGDLKSNRQKKTIKITEKQ